jgi:hypothetical protein
MAPLCTFCKNIPFSGLPPEDEAAHSHQPSLQALSASASQCELCKLILDAVEELRKTFEDEKSGGGSHKFILFNPTDEETGIATQVILEPSASSRTHKPSSTSKPQEKGSSNAPMDRKATQSTLSKIFHKKPGGQDVAPRQLSCLFRQKSGPYYVNEALDFWQLVDSARGKGTSRTTVSVSWYWCKDWKDTIYRGCRRQRQHYCQASGLSAPNTNSGW